MELAVTIVKVVLTLGFVVGGAGKVFNIPNITPSMSETFERFGIDTSLMKLAGAGELIGVALLWAPVLGDSHTNIGAAILAGIALLAAFYHIKFKDPSSELVPAIVMSVLALFVTLFA